MHFIKFKYMKKIILTVIVFFAVTQPSYALKEDSARWYKAYWSGIHVGDLFAQFKEGKFNARVETIGIVKKISKYRSDFSGTYDYKDGKYAPRSYYTFFTRRGGNKTIDITYDENGNVTYDKTVPPDKAFKRKPVIAENKNGTFDPLTAILEIRRQIKLALDEGRKEFDVKVYDGRRLARFAFKIIGRYDRTIEDTPYKVIQVDFFRHPIEGFTKNELKRRKGEEAEYTMYLSDDEYMLPLKVDAEAPLGTAVILFEKECPSIEQCGG